MSRWSQRRAVKPPAPKGLTKQSRKQFQTDVQAITDAAAVATSEGGTWSREVCEHVERVRVQEGVSEAALAASVGLSVDELRARLDGRAPMLLDELARILAALGRDVMDLVHEMPH